MGFKSRFRRSQGSDEKMDRSDSQNRPRRVVKRTTTTDPKKTEGDSSSQQESHVEESQQQLVVFPQASSPGFSDSWGGSWNMDDDDGNPNIFSSRRPRDLTAGLASGVKNIFKGVGLGAAALVAAPAYGASTEGVGGFFKGLGAGVIMAVALPVTGVGYGIAQVARGAFNTPEAVREKSCGKKWDRKSREWKENWYSLEAEQEEVRNEAVAFEEQKKELAANSSNSRNADPTRDGKVVDTEYYDILGVEPTACSAEIRKAYYKLARECHPDKQLDDPTANERFQALGEAYQVLGDDKRRADYDKKGKDAAQEMPIIDSSLFFTMLFGSEALEPFVGKLKMAMFVEIIENTETPGKLTEKIMEFEQRKREVELAIELRNRIQGYVEGNEQQRKQWREAMTEKARELCKHSFGDAMVEAIGWIYENYSDQFLGKQDTFMGIGGRYAKFQAKNRDFGNVWKIAGSAVKASVAAHKMAKAEEKKERAVKMREENIQKKEEQGAKKTEKSKRSKKEDEAKSPAKDEAKASTVPQSSSADSSSTSASDGAEKPTETEETTYPGTSEEEQKAHIEEAKQLAEAMPLILETMLNVCLIDIEATVRKAAKKTLKDLATPIETRRLRAEALIELGKIFQHEAEQFKKEHKDEPVDVMRKMEEVFIRVAQEADQKNNKDESPI